MSTRNTAAGKRGIAAPAWSEFARALEIDEAALRAVAEVESEGEGFLPSPSEKPKVLFEGHAFHRLTGGRYGREHPDISHPTWNRRRYSGSLAGEWKRLEAACRLDRIAALQSASWGLFQVMGFNYPYCGCADVETFVARQYESATQQLALMVKFVSRPPFLPALRKHDWKAFARAYNGPGFATHAYDRRLAEAHARWTRELADDAPARTRRARRRPALPPGRDAFAPVVEIRRENPRRRNVRPDAADLRDWEYRPSIALAPPDALMPNDPKPVKQQGQTNACTGFALATVIEYLLDRGQRPVEMMSGFMLYSMARRYDEWADEGDEVDSGSSLRGALKGWAHHGASAERLWRRLAMPRATNDESDWWLDAVKRPLGAYYRIDPKNIRDMHVALAEVGAIYASAYTHTGWDALLHDAATPAPTEIGEIPVMQAGTGARDQGHAFAIVGYTCDGFIVQNSWGTAWGRGGFAVLPYGDWLANAMDCWVVQLGAVTTEHALVARAPSLRTDASGRVQVSRDATLAYHEISPFVIDMENEGQLSQRGRFRTTPDDLRLLVEHHLPHAAGLWGAGTGTLDIALYAHGGLTTEDAAAETARAWIPYLYSNRVFPVFLMWETGAFQTLGNIFEDAVRGEAEKTGGERWSRFREELREWWNERLEGLARLPGRHMWNEMKDNARDISQARDAGAVQLLALLRKAVSQRRLPRIRLHLVGHSAGAIVQTHLGVAALRSGFEVASISLLAGAVRLDEFDRHLGAAIASRRIRVLLANLTDAAERADDSCQPYGHSLLYLVARSFEGHKETPILGLEKHLVPALPTHAWGGQVQQLRCPGFSWRPGDPATRATTHGGLDNDEAVRPAVVSFIRSG